MAALVVQSRFAGLKIDDDYPSSETQKVKKTKPSTVKKPEPPKKTKNNNNNTKSQSAGKKKKSKAPQETAEQWEQWKQKDEELVDGNYESELQQAILLSKLDYEQKKDVYKQFKKEADLEKKTAEKPSKKQKKKNVMSLEQFNDMVNAGEEQRHNHHEESQTNNSPKSVDKNEEFFAKVRDDAKNEMLKEKINERVRNQKSISDEVITRVQFADTLERKDKEIAALKLEVAGLKQELLTVKSRNRKLCSILGQGEMKDKAEVLVEVERLRGVQAELNAELAQLHTALQRERSRNADSRTKDKKKKSGGDKEK